MAASPLELGDVPAPAGAVGWGYVQTPRVRGLGMVVRGRVAWLRHGRFVVQVTSVGVSVSDDEVVEIARTVFERLADR